MRSSSAQFRFGGSLSLQIGQEVGALIGLQGLDALQQLACVEGGLKAGKCVGTWQEVLPSAKVRLSCWALGIRTVEQESTMLRSDPTDG